MITQEIKVIGTMIGRGGNRRSSTLTYELVDVDWDEFKVVPREATILLFLMAAKRFKS